MTAMLEIGDLHVSYGQVDAVRGVDSSGVLRALLGRELITETGRLETIGRPIVYATTDEFLRQFGLGSLAELPPIELPDIPPPPRELPQREPG